MNCYLYMQPHFLKKSTRDARRCLEMTRYDQGCVLCHLLYVVLLWFLASSSFHYLHFARLRIFQGCIGFSAEYLEAQTLYLKYLNRQLNNLIFCFGYMKNRRFLLCQVSCNSWFLSFTVMQHVTAEGTALVKQAEDAANNKKVTQNCFLLSLIQNI